MDDGFVLTVDPSTGSLIFIAPGVEENSLKTEKDANHEAENSYFVHCNEFIVLYPYLFSSCRTCRRISRLQNRLRTVTSTCIHTE